MKRFYSLLLSAVLILSLCTCGAKPDDAKQNSSLDWFHPDYVPDASFDSNPENFRYSIASYLDHTAKIEKYIGTSKNVAIPESIDGYTIIGFYDGDTFPSFLEKIHIPDTVEDIYQSLFVDTAMYKNQENWVDGNLCIGDFLVSTMANGAVYTVPSHVKHVASSAFEYYRDVEEVIIPDNIITIGHGVFDNCTQLKKITLGNGLKSIHFDAFRGCTSLSAINIPESLKQSDLAAFAHEDLYALDAAAINRREESGLVYIENCLVSGKSTGSEVSVAEGTNYISRMAFLNNGNMEKVIIPDSVKVIGEGAFWGCDNLESIVLGNGVQAIHDYAFRQCDELRSIIIPASVTYIGQSIFCESTALKQLSVAQNNPNYLSDSSGALYSKDQKILYGVPTALGDTYRVSEGTEVISSLAFQNYEQLHTIYLPQSLVKIEDSAFAYCDISGTLTIPAGVSFIGEGLFSGGRVTTLAVDSGSKSFCVQDGVLYNYDKTVLVAAEVGVRDVVLPDSVQEILSDAFGFTKIESFTGSPSLKEIHSFAFSNCDRLKTVSLPGSLVYVASNAISSCYNLSTVTFGGTREQFERLELYLNDDVTVVCQNG